MVFLDTTDPKPAIVEPDSPVKILVVDDSPSKLIALAAILEEPGQSVIGARSGREALRLLLREDFAVILLDINMPDIDGFETAALIRERKRTESTPIIFVTADGDETHARRGYSLGAVDYILAPVIPEVLRTKVGVFVDLYRKTRQLQRQMDERVALAHEQAGRAAAEQLTRRWAFLAEASHVLSRSLDLDATVAGLLHLLTPRVADLAVLSVVDSATGATTHELARIDPASGEFEQRRVEGDQLPATLIESIEIAAHCAAPPDPAARSSRLGPAGSRPRALTMEPSATSPRIKPAGKMPAAKKPRASPAPRLPSAAHDRSPLAARCSWREATPWA